MHKELYFKGDDYSIFLRDDGELVLSCVEGEFDLDQLDNFSDLDDVLEFADAIFYGATNDPDSNWDVPRNVNNRF